MKEAQEEDLSFLHSTTPLTPPLAPSEERRVVKTLLDDQEAVKMTVGATYYVVNFKWWQLWQHYVGWNEGNSDDDGGTEGHHHGTEAASHHAARQRPGPIDNTELLEEGSATVKGTPFIILYCFILFILFVYRNPVLLNLLLLLLFLTIKNIFCAGPGEESDSGEDSEEEEERKSNKGASAAGAKKASKQPQEESLRRGLVKDVDYTLFPSSVFRHIYSW
jgi:hypothetical protein